MGEGKDRNTLLRICEKRWPDKDEKAQLPALKQILAETKFQGTGVTKTKVKASLEEKCGVYGRGGGTSTDPGRDLSDLADRGVKTDARGVPIKSDKKARSKFRLQLKMIQVLFFFSTLVGISCKFKSFFSTLVK